MPKSSMKTIKRRIKSVGSTLQITKAMEMVASSKLRRAKKRAEQMRPYFHALEDLLTDIASQKADFRTILTTKREVKERLFIVIAGDRGLAGGFNSNIMRLVTSYDSPGLPLPKIIAIGRRSAEYFRKKGNDIVAEYPYFAENVKASNCADIADMAVRMFSEGEVDEVRIFYTAYISALQQDATERGLLPYEPKTHDTSGDTPPAPPKSTRYDPSPEAVFDRIIPKLFLSVVSGACVESFASEQSARRNAMENASDNAEEMIEKLSLQYNRARQEKITNEINEIVGGANAIS